MKIKLYVYPVFTKITNIAEEYLEELDCLLSFKPKDYYFTNAYQSGQWDGTIHLLKNNIIYTGLLQRVLLYLQKRKLTYEIIKMYNNNIVFKNMNIPIKLRKYQEEIVEICKKNLRGVVHAPTGSGKTYCFIKLLLDSNVPSLVVVNRNSLIGQLQQMLENVGLSKTSFNIICGDYKNVKIDNFITIATFQSLLNCQYDEIVKNAKMIIFDETHHISMNELGKIAKKAINSFLRFGFSATPWRIDGYDRMLEALIGPKIYTISISKLIQMGYLAKPKIYFIKMPNNLNNKFSYNTLYKQLIEHKKRNETIARCAYEFAKRNRIILISVLRLKHIEKILEELEKIDDIGFNIKIITGKDSMHEKIKTIQKMNKGEYNIVISTLFGEGVDIPNLSVLINVRSVRSSIDAFQQAGRILRIKENNYTPIVIDFYDYNINHQSTYFEKFAKQKIKLYKTEPEFDVKIVNNIEEILNDGV